MADNLFVEWIDVPDDPPVLPPVDEDVPICGLKDIASLCLWHQDNLHLGNQDREKSTAGLLLGPCDSISQGVDMADATILYGGQNAFFPTLESSPSRVSYPSLCPPALSPDSSPTSIASSTPSLRTPIIDPPLANLDLALWNIAGSEEICSAVHLVDGSGNSLEEIPSQVQDMMPEDIACSQTSDTSLPLPSDTPLFMISPPHCGLAVTLGPTYCLSPVPSSLHMSRSLLSFSPPTSQEIGSLPEYAASPSLSPLSTLSFFSRSPSRSTNALPLIDYLPTPPTLSPSPLSGNGERVDVSSFVSSEPTRVASVKLRAKRSVGGDSLLCKVSRRSNAKNDDDDEWNPESERVKRPRVVASSHPTWQTTPPILNCPPDSSTRETGQDSDANHNCCEFCGQGFTRASDYIRHIENSASHPETRKVWPCPYCDSPLGRKDALVRHIRTLHPGQPVIIPEGVLGSHLPSQKELPAQRMGQRKMKMSSKRKDTRRNR